MGENHEKIINYNKKYTKRTLSDFIRTTYTIILLVFYQETQNPSWYLYSFLILPDFSLTFHLLCNENYTFIYAVETYEFLIIYYYTSSHFITL